MAESASIKLSVSGVSKFKNDIKTANDQISTMNADLALLEKQFKATGDQESYLASKAAVLQGKLEQQQKILATAEDALKSMKDNGVNAAASAFQTMQRRIIQAKSDILDTEDALKKVKEGGEGAGSGVGSMNEELKKIGKGVSFSEVTKGIENVTKNLEKGVKAAIQLGKKILQSAKGSTGWADELLTKSGQYGIDVETLQRMENAADIIDVEVDTILKAKTRLGKESKNLNELLGIDTTGMSLDEAFWKAGEAIMGMTDAFEQEEVAQKIFGSKWKDLMPLFALGQEEYNKELENQNVLTEEQVKNLGKADDTIKRLEQEYENLKRQFWAESADKLTGLMQWLVDNKDAVVTAITAIGAALAGLKVVEVATNVGKIVDGFKKLGLLKSAEKVAETAGKTAADAAKTAGTGEAVTKAATGWKLDWSALFGAGGMYLIEEGFKWAINQRNNNREQVRGTEENLIARTADAEQLLIDYINAQKAASDSDSLLTMTADEAEKVMNRVQETYNALMSSEGGAEAMQAYNDWRQENSYGSMYWEIPEALSNMEENVSDLVGNASTEFSDAAGDISDAASTMSKLPAQVAAAVRSAVAGMHVILDGGAMTQVVGEVMAGAVENG